MTNSLRRIITESHTGALVNPPLLVFMTLFCYSRYSLFTLCIQTKKTHQHLSIVYSVLIRFWSGETFSTKDGVFAVLIPSRFFCHCSLSERKIIVCVLEAEYCPKINMSGRVMVNRAHANFKRKNKSFEFSYLPEPICLQDVCSVSIYRWSKLNNVYADGGSSVYVCCWIRGPLVCLTSCILCRYCTRIEG